ncbi:hypothetical protein L228DRAFT_244116 [Xylona heveae TC161]|uniref:Uncharacterized protein n=1 Tax=Xylona heveae (strain CBS 132557 / TC161) TaxID=1328760 RepID=A0A165IS88_XYLHT|nr:hypothetical protein L228DRAFT_244116 [Xylona heveae TC161]KZF25310.1 hypothetical protein L228DRAFT_244116 [Xylona heveae TC161]
MAGLPAAHRRQSVSRKARNRWNVRRHLSLRNALVLLWVIVLWWGERRVFRESFQACQWSSWERWPPGSAPHHVALIADPQLVDPHTYPGRPWPLSSLTVSYTDLYLQRCYSLLQTYLRPDTLFFLGDLFDGGREWGTEKSESPEQQWKKYGESFWLREYDRFGRIFFDHWEDGGAKPGRGQQGRKIISSLPGNHDLGLGVGIQLPVKDRFNAYFGDGNRVDVIGNHSFVSVDTVSLSALGQTNPSAVGVQPDVAENLWKPVMEFLDSVPAMKRRLADQEIWRLNGRPQHSLQTHTAVDADEYVKPEGTGPAVGVGLVDLPTVLLTHIPLYRAPGTPCGPFREHWPPSKTSGGSQPLESDDRNAIAVRAGYQYQNVLTPEISKDVVEKVGNVGLVFSGDDHDYCEIVHREFTAPSQPGGGPGSAGIKEITVKSFSWAMGVRKPGFLMLSMWNPLDAVGQSQGTRSSGHGAPAAFVGDPTIETHLCLLPDQLGIFMRYGIVLGISFALLSIRAAYIMFSKRPPVHATYAAGEDSDEDDEPLLPFTWAPESTFNFTSPAPSSAEHEKAAAQQEQQQYRVRSTSLAAGAGNSHKSYRSESSIVASNDTSGLSARSSKVRTRSFSPGGRDGKSRTGGYRLPLSQMATNGKDSYQDFGDDEGSKMDKFVPASAESVVNINANLLGDVSSMSAPRKKQGKVSRMGRELLTSMMQVAWVVLLWYGWLIWTG